MNENDYSNLLADLFRRFNTESNEFLIEDFLKTCCPNIASQIHVLSPKVEALKEYIDVQITEWPSYAIIIENKVKGAADREKQISDYIHTKQDAGFSNANIYVIYINDVDPDTSSWGHFQPQFVTRYVRVGRKQLLTWFEHIYEKYSADTDSYRDVLKTAIADLQADLDEQN